MYFAVSHSSNKVDDRQFYEVEIQKQRNADNDIYHSVTTVVHVLSYANGLIYDVDLVMSWHNSYVLLLFYTNSFYWFLNK